VSQICEHLGHSGFRLYVVTTVPLSDFQKDASSWFKPHVAGIYHLPQFLDLSLWPAFICYLLEQHRIRILWQIGSTYLYSMLRPIRRLFPSIAVVDLLFYESGHTANHFQYRDCIDHSVTEYAGLRTWLIEHGDRPDSISVIPNGVNLERFSPARQFRDRNTRPLIVGFFGRLSEEKDPDLFVAIGERLSARSDMEFVIGGAGPLEPQLRSSVLQGRVRFLGVVQTSDVLPEIDILVVCSRLDGRPNIVMESLAAGVPVIGSRVGGIPDLLPEESGGILCEPGDLEGFTQAVELLAGNDALRAERSRAARTYAETHFSIDHARECYAALFRGLAKRTAAWRPVNDRERASVTGLGDPHPQVETLSRKVVAAARIAGLVCSPARLGTTCRNLSLLRAVRGSPAAAGELERHFDEDFYRRMYPDVTRSGIPPLWHYVLAGYREGRNPSRRFDTRRYLAQNPEVARSGVNPLLHYVSVTDRAS
jgi:glycosyltransferase involved in cell wall biosynthesis